MNEAETRAEHIDPALAAAGWGVVAGSRIRREYPITLGRIEGHGQRGKPLTADYVLEYRNTKLAVVEAKAWDKELTEGVGQAKDYAGKLAVRFTYASNGQGIYGIDMQTGAEAELAQYPTPDELWNRTFATQNAWRDRFAAIPFEDRGGYFQGRYYQDIAVERVLAAIANSKKRILLTLATGTGKTFIAFQIAWKLFHSRWNLSGEATRRPRILFLADRNILADQAFNAFSAFPEDALVRIAPDDIRKKGKVPKNGSIFFTIFQTFMSGPGETPYFGEYPADFFDLIVIDECHRGGANDESNWRGILDYFAPAVQLGLTATPKRQDNVDTYAYFGEPVFIYSLKDGINDGFLTPFRVRQIATTLDDYVYTPDDTLVEGEIEAGKRYEEKDFNRIIEIREREKKRVEIFMAQIDQREKTLVFCAKLPEFFGDEDELRALWSAPGTRRKLLEGLAEKGFGWDQLAEMQKIIDAENSDLFDVLAHVAYALEPLTREERAAKAMALISTHFSSKQQVFLNFVLSHYVAVGVEELDSAKLTPLLRLKYHDSLADAVDDLGKPEEIGQVFAGFQKYLYLSNTTP